MKKRLLGVIAISVLMLVSVFGLTACKCEHENAGWKTVINATCETVGLKEKTCPDCNITIEKAEIEKTEHALSWQTVEEPTCQDKGVKYQLCTHCKTVFAVDVEEKEVHLSSEWIIDTPATCFENGVKHKKCTECNAILELGSIAKLSHTPSAWIVDRAPTCVDFGVQHKECTACETILENGSIDKLSHTASAWITDKETSCLESGLKHKECTECETVLESEVIDKLSHTPSAWIVDRAPTCVDFGVQHKECTACETILENGSIDKIGHNYKDYKCTVCGFGTGVGGTDIKAEKFEILDNQLTLTVANANANFSFKGEIVVADGATYEIYADADCTKLLVSEILELKLGNNVCYIKVINGEQTKLYTVNIYRRKVFTVEFEGLGVVDIEEGFKVAEPTAQPTRSGYDFIGWNFDFDAPITSNVTINAKWTARTDTRYRVEYYLEDVYNTSYTIVSSETERLTGTTDTTAYAEIKTFEHFTPEKTTVSGNINGIGNTILKVYYQRNEYKVTFNTNGGTRTGGGSLTQNIKYQGSATVPTLSRTGYSLNGWDKSYNNITKSITVTANWQINQYTLTIVYGNGQEDLVITQDYGTAIQNIEEPTIERLGYVFSGWSQSIPTTMPAENLTITANWQAIFYVENGEIKGVLIDLNDLIIPEEIDGETITTILNLETDYGTNSFNSITIPASVTTIGKEVFTFVNKINYLGTLDQWAQIDFDGFMFDEAIPYAEELTYDLYIKGEKISEAKLTTATKISSYAFAGTSITSIEISDSVTSIGDNAFSYCASLTSIEISDSVTSIGSSAFYNCISLTYIKFNGTVEEWDAIKKGSSWNVNVPATEVVCSNGTVSITE